MGAAMKTRGLPNAALTARYLAAEEEKRLRALLLRTHTLLSGHYCVTDGPCEWCALMADIAAALGTKEA